MRIVSNFWIRCLWFNLQLVKELFQAAWDAGGLPTPGHEPPAHLVKNKRPPEFFWVEKKSLPKKRSTETKLGGVLIHSLNRFLLGFPSFHQRHSIAPIHPAWAKVPETRHAPFPPWRFQWLHNGRKAGKNTTQYKPEMWWYGRVRKEKSCASWGFLTVTSMKSVLDLEPYWVISFYYEMPLLFFNTTSFYQTKNNSIWVFKGPQIYQNWRSIPC